MGQGGAHAVGIIQPVFRRPVQLALLPDQQRVAQTAEMRLAVADHIVGNRAAS